VDVVATLLEDLDNRLFKATNSFYVQIKSSSVDLIEYENEEMDWLFALELPFFTARENKRLLGVELFQSLKSFSLFLNTGRKMS
jgi:hypothetical protein